MVQLARTLHTWSLHFSLGGLGAYIFCGFLNHAHNHEKAVVLKVWHQYQHHIT